MSNKYQFFRKSWAVAKDGLTQVAALPQVAQDVWDHGFQNLQLHQSNAQSLERQQQHVRWDQQAGASDRFPTHYNFMGLPITAQGLGNLHQVANLPANPQEFLKLVGLPCAPSSELSKSPNGVLESVQLLEEDTSSRQQDGLASNVSTSRPSMPSLVSVTSNHSSSSRKKGSCNSVLLNKQIMASQSIAELLSLVTARGSHFDFFNISSALARVPKLLGLDQNATAEVHLDAKSRVLVDALAGLMANSIKTFDARGLANAAWAFGKLKYIPSYALPSLIANEAVHRITEFTPQNLSNMLWSFVYMHHRDEKLLDAVACQVQQKVAHFKPQELSNIIWAFASMDYNDIGLLCKLADHSIGMAPYFKEQELSNIIWAFGKLHYTDHTVYDVLLRETKSKIANFLPQGISNTAWALANVSHADPDFFDLAIKHSQGSLHKFDIQGLCNMAWALSSIRHPSPAFFSKVIDQALDRIDRLSPQNLCNVLCSCATIGYRNTQMLDAWAENILAKVHTFEAQSLSSTVWALSKLGYHHPHTYDAIANASLQKLSTLSSQSITSTIWAYANAQHYHPELFTAVADHIVENIASYSERHCCTIVKSFASVRHYDPLLFSAALAHVTANLEMCDAPGISDLLWAYAHVGHPVTISDRALAAGALAMLPTMSQQELSDSLWGLAALDLLDVDVFNRFCSYLGTTRGLTADGVRQAYHAQLMFHSWLAKVLQVPYADLQLDALPHLPEPLQSTGQHLWVATEQDIHLRRVHHEILSAFSAVGIPAAAACVTDDGLLVVDVGLEVNEKPVAVEVTGAQQLTSNPPYAPMGEVAVRRRLLADRGWGVVHVRDTEWEVMGRNPVERGLGIVAKVSDLLGDSVWDSSAPPRWRRGPAAQPTASWTVDASGSLIHDPSGWNGVGGEGQFRQGLHGPGGMGLLQQSSESEEELLEHAQLISQEVGLSVCGQ